MYAKVFRVDVPTNQSQSIESTQGTHKTTSAPRSPNPDVDEGESRAQRKSTIIRLCIPLRRSTRLTSPTPISTTPIPSVAEVQDITLRDTIQLSIAEQKSRDDLEAHKNLEKVKEHLVDEEIKKTMEGSESEDADEVEKIVVVQPVNVIEEEEESAEDDYELRRKVKGKNIEESRNTPSPTTIM
ncbi:hypothetical protein Tco_0412929 [Tanacetum coccineum]